MRQKEKDSGFLLPRRLELYKIDEKIKNVLKIRTFKTKFEKYAKIYTFKVHT